VQKQLPLILWTAVMIGLVWLVWQRLQPPVLPKSSGVVLVDIPWEQLPDVPRFRLLNQAGEEFDSNKLSGRVYAVSFFFVNCPTICRDLNRELARLNERTKNLDLQFLTVSVDPENDTPDLLQKYAQDMGAKVGRWDYLTGPMHRIKELGEHVFQVVIDKATHTDNILLIDKWGRYRDRFKWDDPDEMKRFVEVASALTKETAPPLGQTITTRNALPLNAGKNWQILPWLREFVLTDQQGRDLYSRDLAGDVWIGSFFFSRCPDVCPEQNKFLVDFRKSLGETPLRLISITSDPEYDSLEVLAEYARMWGVKDDSWLFLTGELPLIKRIGSEFFGAAADGDHHSTELFVVDRWGRVRGRFHWNKTDEVEQMRQLIQELVTEKTPLPFERIINPSRRIPVLDPDEE
jgi:cytochrome oxidase Cu insertion factor (SCO1/SenC/PrrC family)